MTGLAPFFAALAAFAGSPTAVSLDFCADQYLIAVAAPEQILAVSPGAVEADSRLREKARDHRRARPTVEEIAPLKPDLVIRFWGGAAGLDKALDRFGARVVTLSYPDDFDAVRGNLRLLGELLGREEKSAEIIADLDVRLAALAARQGPAPAAVYVTPGGVTAGAGTMIDAMMDAAGVRNAAGDQFGWPPLSLETLVLDPPALVVTGFFEAATEYVNHWSAARHPVFARAFDHAEVAHLPADIVSCPAWFAVDGAEAIAAAAGRKLKVDAYAD